MPLPTPKAGVLGAAAWLRDFAGGRFRLGDGPAPAAFFLSGRRGPFRYPHVPLSA
ncbi:MAG: hypothetical protein ACUVQK_13585 [Thermogutta sp.]